MNKYEELLELINRIQENLVDLFSSGFNAVHDSTLNELKKLSSLCESFGLSFGNESLEKIYEKLMSKRHVFEFNYSECVEEYCKLNEYVVRCKQKLEIMKLKDSL